MILITERQWRHAGSPINEVVTADAYLEAVLAKGLDPEVLFKELAIARGVPIHCLPQQRIDIPLDATCASLSIPAFPYTRSGVSVHLRSEAA